MDPRIGLIFRARTAFSENVQGRHAGTEEAPMNERWQKYLKDVYRGHEQMLRKYGIENEKELEQELIRIADKEGKDLDKIIHKKDDLATNVVRLVIARKLAPDVPVDIKAPGEHDRPQQFEPIYAKSVDGLRPFGKVGQVEYYDSGTDIWTITTDNGDGLLVTRLPEKDDKAKGHRAWLFYDAPAEIGAGFESKKPEEPKK